jgi:Zn-dependent metalloprotease
MKKHPSSSACLIVVLLSALGACAPVDPTPDPPLATPDTFEDRIANDSEVVGFVERTETGTVSAIATRIPIPGHVMNDPVRRADWFLAEYGEELGIDDPLDDLELRDTLEGEEGSGEETDTLVRYQRTHEGVPVAGAEINVEVDGEGDGAITTVVAHVPADIDSVSTTPTITEAEAIALATADMDRATASSAELVIFNEGLFRGEDGPSILAWRVPTLQLHVPAAVTRFVDATDGTVQGFAYNEMYTARHRRTYDASYEADQSVAQTSSTLVLDESGPVMGRTPDAHERLVHDTAGDVWSYFWSHHQRDSHDGRGADVVSYGHLGPMGCEASGNCNAFWWNGAMWFMDSMVTDDIFAHEYTHGLTEASSGLVYAGDSGALNESMSDVFGQFYDNGDWDIGEGCAYGVLRSLQDPTTYGQPRHVMAKTTFAAGTKLDHTNDYGGVHNNSGIPNYAAYLINAGGTNPDSGVTVNGLGQTKTERIYFRALTWYMTSGSSFQGAKIALRLAAWKFATKELYGVTYEDCGSVLNAYGSVGIGSPDMDNDCFTDAVDVCPMDYNPDQDRSICREPICGGPYSQCSDAEECCEGLECVNGDCVDCEESGGVGETCDPTVLDACCGTLVCSRAAGGGSTCCRSDTDRCSSDDECCGDMQCLGERCACRASGESCQSGRECCGSSYCDDGVCT